MKQTIEKTMDYSRFKFAAYNRDIDTSQVARLTQSIRTNGYLSEFPILVDSNLVIIDGQHRFAACKQLGLPIIYTRTKREFDASNILNINSTQKSWTLKDKVKSLSEDGTRKNRDEYKKLISFLNANSDFAYSVLCSLLTTKANVNGYGGSTTTAVLKEGFTFAIPEKLPQFLNFYRTVRAMKLKLKREWYFMCALWTAYNDQNFQEKHFLEVAIEVQNRANYSGYKIEIEKWYNYRRRSGKIQIVNIEDFKDK